MTIIRYLFIKQKLTFFLYLLLSIIFAGFEVFLAYIMSVCVDLALSGEISHFLTTGLLFVLYIFLFIIADYLTKYVRNRILKNAEIMLRNDIIHGIFTKSILSFHEKNTADYVSTMSNDLDMIITSSFQTALYMIPDILSFAVSFICIFSISWQIALYIVVLTLVSLTIPKILSPKISTAKSEQSQNASDFTVAANEHLLGFDLLHTYHLIKKSSEELYQANRKWATSRFHVRQLNSIAGTLSYGFSNIVCIGLYFFGALLVVAENMTVGEMIAITQLAVYVMSPLQTFSSDFAEIISTDEIIRKLEQLIYSVSITGNKVINPKDFMTLKLDHVYFTYDQKEILHDISFTFEKGKKYLLSGSSGSGKTTLIQLLTRSLKPEHGNIFFNDINISDIDEDSYTSFITSCSQSTIIFNDTLRNNVTLFSDLFSDEKIMHALHLAGFDKLIAKYPDGLNQKISQSGRNLSGGEKQRIALARMFLFETPFVILDETFSNLDTESMTGLMRTITSMNNKTIIYIGHNIPLEIHRMFDVTISLQNHKISVKEMI